MFTNIHKFIGHLVEDELSYSITRPYNYGRNFKIWVFTISILVLVGLTVLNLATNGFDKQVLYTSDPNTTVSQLHWYNHKIFTWGDDTLEPKCQNVDIPIGHEFLTTNLGLRYTVQKIEAQDGQPRASVSYHNNTLTDCEMDNVGISLINSGFAKPSKEYRWQPWIPSTADAVARCNISTDEGPFRLEFKTQYITYVESNEFIAKDDPAGHATFWWGARLLKAYFVGTQYVMSGPLPDTNDDTPIYPRARLSYETNSESSKKSIKDPSLFYNWFYFLHPDTGIRETIENSNLTTSMLYNNVSYSKSRPLTEGLFFAKVFQSVILADLGNNQTENFLLDSDLLQYALNPGEDDFNRIPGAPLNYNPTNPEWWKFAGIIPPGEEPKAETAVPFHEAYAKLKDKIGELGIKAATIHSVYTCAVPAKKATSTMFLFTLVANLSLFQTAWGVFKHVLDQKTTWKNKTANYCEGCFIKDYGVIEMHDGEYSPMSLRQEQNSPSIGTNSTKALLGDEDGHSQC
ncbi:hypothetical protein N0V90_013506 [Kalmusia sp. IMI 367209]|nr:hypothetical protein N0V90_013506 [Kalmusia sp. IMI 367209]